MRETRDSLLFTDLSELLKSVSSRGDVFVKDLIGDESSLEEFGCVRSHQHLEFLFRSRRLYPFVVGDLIKDDSGRVIHTIDNINAVLEVGERSSLGKGNVLQIEIVSLFKIGFIPDLLSFSCSFEQLISLVNHDVLINSQESTGN